MSQTPLFDPADFRLPEGVAHVCAGGETAFLWNQDRRQSRFAIDNRVEYLGRTAQEAQVEVSARAGHRTPVAEYQPAEIGFVSNVAEGVSIIAESLDWRDGDTICIDADEYPSVVGTVRAAPGRSSLRIAHGKEPGTGLRRLTSMRGRGSSASGLCLLSGRRALRSCGDSAG